MPPQRFVTLESGASPELFSLMLNVSVVTTRSYVLGCDHITFLWYEIPDRGKCPADQDVQNPSQLALGDVADSLRQA